MKATINRQEAGVLVLSAQMRGLTLEECLADISVSRYPRPAHTATIRRLARQMAKVAYNEADNRLKIASQFKDNIEKDKIIWLALSDIERLSITTAITEAHDKRSNRRARDLLTSKGLKAASISIGNAMSFIHGNFNRMGVMK